MDGYTIGLSGLQAASAALVVVGNNTSNAATEGYHRQTIELAASVGGGVEVKQVARLVSTLVENELLSEGSAYAQVSQELTTLSTLETTLGEFSSDSGLNATLDQFFGSLESLAANPSDDVYRSTVVMAAQTLCSQLQSLATSVESLQEEVQVEATNVVQSVNLLTSQIADLNSRVMSIETTGGNSNNLRDTRAKLISELARLVSIETQERDSGVIDISVGGMAIVSGTKSLDITVETQEDGDLEVLVAGNSTRGIDGGELGGLLALRNDLLGEMQDDLDALAKSIIQSINEHHVQGLGEDGSFTELTGWSLDDEMLTGENSSVTDGAFYVRVTDTATGDVARYEVDVDVSSSSPDTLESIAAKIDAIGGVSASIIAGQLTIVSDVGYAFDFLPAVESEPATTTFTAASSPTVTVSGVYDGEENDTLTFTVATDGTGSGAVGNGELRLVVTNGDGDIIDTLSIGDGYAAGDEVELVNGISITLSTGDLNEGDAFQVDVYATTDTSGFLAVAGMNVFFSGSNASDIAVSDDILNSLDRIATSYGANLTDNTAALRMAGVKKESQDNLGGRTISSYYQQMVSDLGQEVSLRESRKETLEAIILDLEAQQSETSGVDTNEEAAQLLVFEKMYQGMAEYLNALQTCIESLMQIL